MPERSIGGLPLTRILNRLAVHRELPKAIRTDNGKELCCKAMLTWAHKRGVKLFLIEPGCSGQQIPDTGLSFSSASAGGIPSLN